MDKIGCIHHNTSLDGKTAAALIKMKYKETFLIPISHGLFSCKKYPDIKDYDTLYIVDVHMNFEDINTICRQNKSIIYIDHHISSNQLIEEYKYRMPDNFIGIIYENLNNQKVSTSELVYLTLYPKNDIPLIIALIGSFETSRHKRKPQEKKVEYFYLAATKEFPDVGNIVDFLTKTAPEHKIPSKFYNDGKAIHEYLMFKKKETNSSIL